jgi:hypothetical protein
MFPFVKNKPNYSAIDHDENDEELKLGDASYRRSNNVILKTGPWSLLLILLLLLSSIVSSWVVFFNIKHFPQQDLGSVISTQPSISCQQAPTRREWRTLNLVEQYDYIRAVRCLSTKPSKLGNKGTMYDDFPWVHKHTSSYSTLSIFQLTAIFAIQDHSLTKFQLPQLICRLHSFHGIATTFIFTRQP